MHIFRKRSRLPHLLIGSGLLAAVLSISGAAETVLSASLVLAAILISLLALFHLGSLIPTRRGTRDRHIAFSPEPPFVSIHIALGTETTQKLARTLHAIQRLNYPTRRFEVIVLGDKLSQGTTIEHLCREAGPNIRFHQSVESAAARVEALNAARLIMHPDATVIAVLSPGDSPLPHFLRVATAALDSREISHVRFSASFGNHSPELQILHAGNATLPGSSPFIIRRGALAEVGGWSAKTITPEAELGTRLIAAGFHGRYVSMPACAGDHEESLADLAQRRCRHSAGHAQCLVEIFRLTRIPRNGISIFWRTLQQLFASLDLQALSLVLALAAMLGSFATGFSAPFPRLFAWAIVLWLFTTLASLIPIAVGTKGSLPERLRACIIHQALAPEASWGTLCGFLGKSIPQLDLRK